MCSVNTEHCSPETPARYSSNEVQFNFIALFSFFVVKLIMSSNMKGVESL